MTRQRGRCNVEATAGLTASHLMMASGNPTTRNRVTRNRFGVEKIRPVRNVSSRKSSEIHGERSAPGDSVHNHKSASAHTRNRVTRNRFGVEKNRPARNVSP
jgi:hypothetical protein